MKFKITRDMAQKNRKLDRDRFLRDLPEEIESFHTPEESAGLITT